MWLWTCTLSTPSTSSKMQHCFFFFPPLSRCSVTPPLPPHRPYGNCVLLQQRRQKILLKEESKGKAKTSGGLGGRRGWAETSYGAHCRDPIQYCSKLILSHFSAKNQEGVTICFAQRNLYHIKGGRTQEHIWMHIACSFQSLFRLPA